LVAIATTASLAVAYCVGGVAAIYIVRFEKLESSNIYARTEGTSGGNWTITMKVKNTGSADTTIDDIFLNGVSFVSLARNKAKYRYGAEGWKYSSSNASVLIVIASGSSVNIQLNFVKEAFSTNPPSAGTTTEVKLHTVSGQNYLMAVMLP